MEIDDETTLAVYGLATNFLMEKFGLSEIILSNDYINEDDNCFCRIVYNNNKGFLIIRGDNVKDAELADKRSKEFKNNNH